MDKLFTNKKLLIAMSIVIPIVVGVLIGLREPLIKGMPLKFLPPIYATLNGATSIALILALVYIKKGNRVMHEKMINLSIGMSIIFLVMYVAYHITTPTTVHPQNAMRTTYLIILFSHILLSVAVIPLALFSIYHAKLSNFDKHRKIVKFAFPIWLYVAISGVVIYLMISPYY